MLQIHFAKYSLKELLYFATNRLPHLISGKIRGNLIYAHWGRGLNNFGDNLSPDILKYYGFTPVFCSSNKKADILLAGTTLQWTSSDYGGYVIGTGGDNVPYNFPNAKIWAVRGCLTLNNIKRPIAESYDTIKLGDPGLLMSYVYPCNSSKKQKKYILGIVPHFMDKKLISQLWEHKFEKKNVLFINVLDSPRNVIEKIVNCEYIVSSSLHGLIIADAYHIPNRWLVPIERSHNAFSDYKFHDYYSSLGIVGESLEITGNESIETLIDATTMKPIEKIEHLKKELNQLMIAFALHFRTEK
jgi:pyruvyltransferase